MVALSHFEPLNQTAMQDEDKIAKYINQTFGTLIFLALTLLSSYYSSELKNRNRFDFLEWRESLPKRPVENTCLLTDIYEGRFRKPCPINDSFFTRDITDGSANKALTSLVRLPVYYFS